MNGMDVTQASSAATARSRGHSLVATDRSQITVKGVSEVVSFDDSAVILRTSLGTLCVHGRELQLKTLTQNGGQVAVEGTVSALVYEEPRSQGGWLRRLLG